MRVEGEALPVHHGASVEGHEEDLTAASRAHRGEEDLQERDAPVSRNAATDRDTHVQVLSDSPCRSSPTGTSVAELACA